MATPENGEEIVFTHPESPGRIVIYLPLNMGMAGQVLSALGRLGWIIRPTQKVIEWPS